MLTILVPLAALLFMAGELAGWWQLITPTVQGEAVAAPVEQSVQIEPAATAVISSLAAEPTTVVASRAVIGEPAPAFSLPDLLEPTQYHALSDYAGRPLILNFWASWCPPCRAEMPALQRAYDQNKGDGLGLLGINQTYIDDAGLAADFVKELGLTFPNAWDETGVVSERMYRVLGLPTTVFISAEGEVAYIQIGPLSDSRIDVLVAKLMAGEELAP